MKSSEPSKTSDTNEQGPIELRDEHQEAVFQAERQQRREELEVQAVQAERKAGEALRAWMTTMRKIITDSPSIGDALLESRDQSSKYFPIADQIRKRDDNAH